MDSIEVFVLDSPLVCFEEVNLPQNFLTIVLLVLFWVFTLYGTHLTLLITLLIV